LAAPAISHLEFQTSHTCAHIISESLCWEGYLTDLGYCLNKLGELLQSY
jgi:hypothetical protein